MGCRAKESVPEGVDAMVTKKGFLCVIEGADGVGKSTLVNGLWQRLNDHKFLPPAPGLWLMKEKEPEFLIEEIKHTTQARWLRLTYLFIRQREMRLAGEFGQRLRNGNCIVLQDRYYHSTCVYESLLGNVKPADILDAHGYELLQPDVTLVLDLPEKAARRRLQTITEESIAKETQGGFFRRVEDHAFQHLVRDAYRFLEHTPGFEDVVILDADMESEALLANAWHIIYNNYLFPWLRKNQYLQCMGLPDTLR